MGKRLSVGVGVNLPDVIIVKRTHLCLHQVATFPLPENLSVFFPMQIGKDQSLIAPCLNYKVIVTQLHLKFKFFTTKKSHPIRPTMQKNTPEKRECF